MHWDRSKSDDELDARLKSHVKDAGMLGTDLFYRDVKIAWRKLARSAKSSWSEVRASLISLCPTNRQLHHHHASDQPFQLTLCYALIFLPIASQTLHTTRLTHHGKLLQPLSIVSYVPSRIVLPFGLIVALNFPSRWLTPFTPSLFLLSTTMFAIF